MTLEAKYIQKEGVKKTTIGGIVFSYNFMSMAMIPFQIFTK
jgi:hypothetical protein